MAVRPTAEDPPGYASRFDLRIDHVLNCRSEEIVSFDHLALSPCSTILFVPDGATIALALDASAFQPPMEVNAPAFIHGRSYESQQPGSLTAPETITLPEVFALAGVTLPATDTSPPRSSPLLAGLVLVVLALIVGSAIIPRRTI